MIDSIDLHLLRNDEHLQMNKDIAILTLQNDPKLLKIEEQYKALAQKNIELDALYKKQTDSELTKEIVAIDERRDRAISGLVLLSDAYKLHFDSNFSQAATLLSDNFKLYGPLIARQNLQSETNIITSIVNDLEEKPELIAALITLGLNNWKEELKVANSLFASKYLERTVKNSEVSKETMVEKRKETNQVYYELLKHIEAYATIDKNNLGYAKLINQINTTIDQYKQLLEKRKKNKNEGEKPAPNEPLTD